jgi:hypothetical protein
MIRNKLRTNDQNEAHACLSFFLLHMGHGPDESPPPLGRARRGRHLTGRHMKKDDVVEVLSGKVIAVHRGACHVALDNG